MRQHLCALAQTSSKRLCMSEVGFSGPSPHSHTAVGAALDLATGITQDLSLMKCDSWVYWQVVEDENHMEYIKQNWGLVHAPFTSGIEHEWWKVTKQYWGMMHFAGIRPGAKVLDCN
ncbi:hypothetical protein HK104_005766, partial [Borealophlyctis nickersoniae]